MYCIMFYELPCIIRSSFMRMRYYCSIVVLRHVSFYVVRFCLCGVAILPFLHWNILNYYIVDFLDDFPKSPYWRGGSVLEPYDLELWNIRQTFVLGLLRFFVIHFHRTG